MQNQQLIDEIEEQLKHLCIPQRAHNERRGIMTHFRQKIAKEQAAQKKSQPKTTQEE